MLIPPSKPGKVSRVQVNRRRKAKKLAEAVEVKPAPENIEIVKAGKTKKKARRK